MASLLALGALALGGCSAQSTSIPQTIAPSPRLEAASSQAMTLRFHESATLQLRRVDANGLPEAGVEVAFALTGDSGGSSLDRARATTDDKGLAQVVLSAGTELATFHVEASSEGAEKLIFEVVVVRGGSVTVAVRLEYRGIGSSQVQQVRAGLYPDLSCSTLRKMWQAQAPDPEAWREQYVPVASATIEFSEIPARGYALVGWAEDLDRHPIARGCVDLLDAQVTGSGGSRIELPLPLSSVVPVLAEAYLVDSELDLSGVPSPVAAWDRLAACPVGFTESLLDAVVATLDGQAGAALSARRTPVDKTGCRPEVDGGVPTLDAQLHQLLWKQNGSLAQLPSVAKDLQAITRRVQLGSRLALTARDSAHYFASHALTRVGFADAAGHTVSYDPAMLGLPVTSLDAIAADFDGTSFYLQEHGLTLRLPWLWSHALADLALAPRTLPTDLKSLVADVVAQAERQDGNANLRGCAAVASLLCKAIGGNGPCTVEQACVQGLSSLASTLEQPLTPAGGVDLTLGGRANASDANADLTVERLSTGEWQAVVGLAGGAVLLPGTFTGTAAPIP